MQTLNFHAKYAVYKEVLLQFGLFPEILTIFIGYSSLLELIS